MSKTIGQLMAERGMPLPGGGRKGPRKVQENFDVPPHQPTKTSRDAAISMSGKTHGLRKDVYTLLLARGPMTDEAIAVALHLNPSTARPRRIELTRDGVVVKVGVGTNLSGRKATLWGVAASIGGA